MESAEGTRQGRFSRVAAEARSKTPAGVSSREGWFIIVYAIVGMVALSVIFNAQLSEWMGIIRFGTLAVLLVLVPLLTARVANARGVHPRGFRKQFFIARAIVVLLPLVGGWFWIVPESHGTPWYVVTLITLLCFLPLTMVGMQLVKAGRK